MIEKKSVLDQPELHRSGVLYVRLAKLLVEDGVEIGCEWHRTGIPHDIDPAAQMAAVNAHLAEMNYPAVSQADVDCVVASHALMKGWLGL